MERMATANPFQSEPTSFKQAKTFHGDKCILRTCWNIPTTCREVRRNAALIELNQTQTTPTRNTRKARDDTPPCRRVPSAFHLIPALSRSPRKARCNFSGEAVLVLGVAINSMSYPGAGSPTERAVSRNTRLLRLRTTALPSFLPAINATRPRGSRWLSACFTMMRIPPPEKRTPRLKTSLIWSLDLIVSIRPNYIRGGITSCGARRKR